MSGDVEKAHEKFPAPSQPGEVVFYVDSEGEATGEIGHLRQVQLALEQLDDSSPSMVIDMRKISGGGWSGLEGIQVMLLDFGVPPRPVTISGDFQRPGEVGRSAYDSENDSSPNTLTIEAPEIQDSKHTHHVDERYHDSGASLRRGDSIFLVHDGEPISTRTGFLSDIDGLGVTEHGAWGVYENILKLTYEGHELIIETQNHSQALVAYGKSVGFAERHTIVEEVPEEIQGLLEGIEDEETRAAVMELHARLTKLAMEHETTLGEIETVEALLTHNKGLLKAEKGKAWGLQREIDRLKSQSAGGTSDDSDWLRKILGERPEGSRSTLEQHCEVIGLNPSIAGAEPELVVSAAKSMRKVWAKKLHPDVSPEDGEALKAINASADAIIGHFD